MTNKQIEELVTELRAAVGSPRCCLPHYGGSPCDYCIGINDSLLAFNKLVLKKGFEYTNEDLSRGMAVQSA